jgi:CTP:molybdopterin cytidylyltransferase MocA
VSETPAAFVAVVLAGDRRPDDPLVVASGQGCKALLPIAGRPMLLWVLDALAEAPSVAAVQLSGPPSASLAASLQLQALTASGAVGWHAPEDSPSLSARAAMRELPANRPVLLTTADHPLLRAAYVEHFCAAARASGADVAVGVAPYTAVRELFPEMRKTLLRFRDGDYCGCNLFAFLTERGRAIAGLWREVESARKTPWRVISLIGWGAVLRYRLGWLSLDDAMRLLSRRAGLEVIAVRLPFGEAAVDVDSPADHAQVELRLRGREQAVADSA